MYDTYFFPTDFKFPSFGDTFTEAQSTLSKQLFKKPIFEATTTSFTSNSHQLKSDSLTAITEETASESNSDKKNSHQHLSSSRMIPAESKYTYEKGSILDPYFDLEDDDSIFADLPSSINLDAQENAIYNTYMNESSTLYASDDEFIRGGRGCQVDGEECVYFMDVGCSNFQEGLLKGLQRMLFDSKKKNLSSVASMTSSTLLSRSFSKESRSTTRNRLSDDLMIAKSYASMTFSDDGSYSSVQSDPYGRRGHNRSSRKSSSKKKNKKKTKGRKICQKVVSFEDENARRKITEKVVSFDDEFNEEVINQW